MLQNVGSRTPLDVYIFVQPQRLNDTAFRCVQHRSGVVQQLLLSSSGDFTCFCAPFIQGNPTYELQHPVPASH
jgi:hypothetical protein